MYEPLRCVRTSRYKLIRDFGSYKRGLPANCDDSPSKDLFLENGYFDRPREREMLFDLYFDPGERRNLAGNRSRRLSGDSAVSFPCSYPLVFSSAGWRVFFPDCPDR